MKNDEVPISVLKASNISQLISHPINTEFVNGIYPNLLKISKIIPIYKKESNTIKPIIDQYLCYPTFIKLKMLFFID